MVLRAVLGGALGGLILDLGLINPFTFGTTWLQWLLATYLIFGLPSGSTVGLITGILILIVHNATQSNLEARHRATIGFMSALIVYTVVILITNTDSWSDLRRWPINLLPLLLFAAVSGGLSGIIAGNQSDAKMSEDNR